MRKSTHPAASAASLPRGDMFCSPPGSAGFQPASGQEGRFPQEGIGSVPPLGERASSPPAARRAAFPRSAGGSGSGERASSPQAAKMAAFPKRGDVLFSPWESGLPARQRPGGPLSHAAREAVDQESGLPARRRPRWPRSQGGGLGERASSPQAAKMAALPGGGLGVPGRGQECGLPARRRPGGPRSQARIEKTEPVTTGGLGESPAERTAPCRG